MMAILLYFLLYDYRKCSKTLCQNLAQNGDIWQLLAYASFLRIFTQLMISYWLFFQGIKGFISHQTILIFQP